MLDLSVLSIFDPVSLSSTKNSSGEGISFESKLDPFLKSGSQDADKLAKIIEKEAAKSTDEAKKLELIERSLAYIRAKGGNDLSSKVYDNLKDEDRTNGFIDVFGTADKVPSSVQSNPSAKTAWDKIMTGRAYDHIEENKNSIIEDLESARDEADSNKIEVANPALVNLKEELMENGMSGKEADKDISRMLRETNLLKSGERVEIELGSVSNTLSPSRTRDLERYRDSLTERINRARTPEAAKRILEEEEVIKGFEKLRPKGIKPEVFYTEQMQAVLDGSTLQKFNDENKNYTVAAIPSLKKIKAEVDGKEQELIPTSNENVFVNSGGNFVVKQKNDKYSIIEPKEGKIKVDETTIDITDIKPSQPKIRILMNTNENKVEDESITATRQYLEDQKLVYGARNDEEAKQAKQALDREIDLLNESKVALAERRKKEEKEGKSDNNDTLQLIVGIISAVGTIVAALRQGRGTTTTVTGGSGYNRQYGYGYGSYAPYPDKYGYNRGYQATVDEAHRRSEQYLSTLYNNPVRTRASIMRQNGMYAIQNGAGIHRY